MSDNNVFIEGSFDKATNTITYLVADLNAKKAVIIDPVLDYDQNSGEVDTNSVDAVLARARELDLEILWSLETHAHADHLSASPMIKALTGAKIGIGEHITKVQEIFRPVFNMDDLKTDGSDFDRLFAHGDKIEIGNLEMDVLFTPGHTPADVSYKIGNNVFVGDTLFMPDYGTARTDFPGGDAKALYASIQSLLALPDDTKLYMCHDYKAPGRDDFAWETTVKEQKQNLHIKDGVSLDEFVAMRNERDSSLSVPRLLLPSIQVNIRAGRFPKAEQNGVHYLLVPVKTKKSDLMLRA
ncbi:MAG: MBL fold metallo-hydrolase [Devosiaceae bacterium]|nr:MBL fold metallo-hydrolase [Devosiaceae bacterium]